MPASHRPPLRPLWWSVGTPLESKSLFREKRASSGLFGCGKPSKMNNCPICLKANKHKLLSESCWRQKRTETENCQTGEGRYHWFENEFDLFRQLEGGSTYKHVCSLYSDVVCSLATTCFLLCFNIIWFVKSNSRITYQKHIGNTICNGIAKYDEVILTQHK